MDTYDILEIIKQGSEKAYLQKCREQRELFLEGKPVDLQIVPKAVYDSWVRSKNNGVDPYEKIRHHPVDKGKSKEFAYLKECLERFAIFFNSAIEIIDYQGYIFSFSIKEGITKQIYDNVKSPFTNCIGECTERTVGTTAAGLAIAQNKPQLLVSPLFYQFSLNIRKVSAAAPLHNCKGEIFGAITIIFEDIKDSQEAFWLATYLAQVFDRLYMPLYQQHDKEIKAIVDKLPQGIAYVKNNNIHYNEKFLNLLKLSKGEDVFKKCSKLFSRREWEAIFACKEINLDGKQLQVSFEEFKDIDYGRSRLITLAEKQPISQQTPLLQAQSPQQQKSQIKGLYTFADIVGNSPLLVEAKTIGMNVAATSVPVLIFGENGTGKEMFAQAIHEASPRRDKPFIAINCGAIPAELVESELFGYEEGSFTGALKGGKMGKIEAASGGTLFLDEIESMPLKDQIKLLRVLSTGKIQRVGSTKETPVDIRLISATKKDLLEESDKGLFREDLYFRISTFIIELPALRQRKEDILLLTKEFIRKLTGKYGITQPIEMEEEFVEALENYSWRGNVRELEHAIEHAIIMMGSDSTLKLSYLSKGIQTAYHNYKLKGLVEDVLTKGLKKQEQGLLDKAEAMIIDYVLKSVGGNVTAAAEKLGVTRKTIYNKLQEHPDLRIVK